jgi:hypothetical protein
VVLGILGKIRVGYIFTEDIKMIHAPEIEVTCDNDDCSESVFLPMNWYVGGYDLKNEDVERILSGDHNWKTDGDKHYCESCREV